MPGRKKKQTMSKKMVKAVREISKAETLRLAETKVVGRQSQNNQLYHNVTTFRGPFLETIAQGVGDPTLQGNANARIGDELLLKNFEQRYWLSNKLDRPNVMYRITTFWYPTNAGGAPPVPAMSDVYFMGDSDATNTMIQRVNNEQVRLISDKFVFSTNNYAQPYQTQPFPVIAGPGILGREHSQLRTIRSNWKGKKIKYLDAGGAGGIGSQGVPKGHDIWVAITAYDAYGTLTTDNIASYALNYQMSFKDL